MSAMTMSLSVVPEVMNMNIHLYRHARRTDGFTIVEVLISLLILSAGLMGLAGLQVVGLQNTLGGAQRTQAAFLAYDITDRMRTNTAAVTAGSYNLAAPGTAVMGGMGMGTAVPNPIVLVDCFGAAANCSATQMAAHDLGQWQTQLGAYLNTGTGAIATVDNGTTTLVTISIQWADAYTVDAGNEIATFTTELPR